MHYCVLMEKQKQIQFVLEILCVYSRLAFKAKLFALMRKQCTNIWQGRSDWRAAAHTWIAVRGGKQRTPSVAQGNTDKKTTGIWQNDKKCATKFRYDPVWVKSWMANTVRNSTTVAPGCGQLKWKFNNRYHIVNKAESVLNYMYAKIMDRLCSHGAIVGRPQTFPSYRTHCNAPNQNTTGSSFTNKK